MTTKAGRTSLGIIGNDTAEKVLLYLQNYGEGYARAIAATYGLALNGVQRQLLKLEQEGVVVSQTKGRTRVFQWNPRYPFRRELSALLEKALSLVPEAQAKAWFLARQRPRRVGKAL
jgi:predicted ArsR family transcriptional regulator